MEDRYEILLEVASLIWRRKIKIAELYEVLGVDLDDVQHSDPSDVVTELAGIFTGWHNPPTEN